MRYVNSGGLLLLMLTLFNCGCKKHNDKGSLTGTWELRQTSAAMNPQASQYPAGNGNIVELKDGNYKIYKGGQVIKSGHYSSIADATVGDNVCLVLPKGQYTNRIAYEDSTTLKIFYQVQGNTLSFYAGCYAYDAGHQEIFERVQPVGSGN
ncbi:MAG TPA: hypothetical protein VGM31_05460 [Puia sp.]|jgi:hypothetical protein